MKNKNLIIILMILTITFTIMGGSLAYFTWQTSEKERTDVSFTAEANFSCSADIGGTISSNDTHLMPDDCTGTHSIKRTLTTFPKITDNNTIYMNLWLDINEMSSGLSASNNLKYALTTSNTSCDTDIISQGTFTNKTKGNRVVLLDNKIYSSTITDTYYLYLWLDSAETSNTTQNQSFSLFLNGKCSDRLYTGADMLIDYANPKNLSYNNATAEQKANMWTFYHDATVQTEALTDYRYIGSSPNNYIEFNNEVWRIIGVFDNRIKIMKDDLITSTSYDYKQSGVGSSTSSYGSNDWTDSQLMYMLNPTPYTLKSGYTYENNIVKDSNGNIIYQTGCKPSSISTGGTYTCTANTWSLSQTALSQIDKTTYYLGRVTLSSDTKTYYKNERSNNTYTKRDTSWYGYVALPYPSDYAYTFANGVNDICYNSPYNCSSGIPSSSWMYKEMTFWLNSNISAAVTTGRMIARSTGNVYEYYNSTSSNVRPVVYLKQNTKLTGTGTSTDMYKIS